MPFSGHHAYKYTLVKHNVGHNLYFYEKTCKEVKAELDVVTIYVNRKILSHFQLAHHILKMHLPQTVNYVLLSITDRVNISLVLNIIYP